MESRRGFISINMRQQIMQRDGGSSVFICQRFGHFSPSTKSTQPAGIRLGSIRRHEDETEREMEIMTFILRGTTTHTYIWIYKSLSYSQIQPNRTKNFTVEHLISYMLTHIIIG